MSKVKIEKTFDRMYHIWRVSNSIGNVAFVHTSIRYHVGATGLIRELKENAAPRIGADLVRYNPCLELPAQDFNTTGRTYIHTLGEYVFTFPRAH